MRRHALDEIEKAFRLVVEPVEHHVLHTQPCQPHNQPHRRRRENRVDDHRQRRMPGDDFLDGVGKLAIPHGRVDDQQIRRLRVEERVELGGIRRGLEGVCVPQDDTEMSEQISRKERYDVQSEVREDIGAKTRFFVTKCRFTQRTATLPFGCGSPRVTHPTGVVNVPPPDLPRCDRDCLPGCVRLRYFADSAEPRCADRRTSVLVVDLSRPLVAIPR